MRSAYSILSALANQHKYTGQEHRVAGTKKTRTGKTPSVAEKNIPKVYKRKT